MVLYFTISQARQSLENDLEFEDVSESVIEETMSDHIDRQRRFCYGFLPGMDFMKKLRNIDTSGELDAIDDDPDAVDDIWVTLSVAFSIGLDRADEIDELAEEYRPE